jgi:NifU-like protein involved in Fe-S cluster formation
VRDFPEHLREHVQNPRRAGEPAVWQHRGEARNPACGDHVVVFLEVREGRVIGSGFLARGCPAAMGLASAAGTLLEGLAADATLPGAARERYEAAWGKPRPAHRHALSLYSDALAAALRG